MFFRISLLVISVSCAVMTVCLTIYTRHHRRVKVFRVASPVFLSITLLGCAIMYMEVSMVFVRVQTMFMLILKICTFYFKINIRQFRKMPHFLINLRLKTNKSKYIYNIFLGILCNIHYIISVTEINQALLCLIIFFFV